jgi:hypothetical protein
MRTKSMWSRVVMASVTAATLAASVYALAAPFYSAH